MERSELDDVLSEQMHFSILIYGVYEDTIFPTTTNICH
jgi:hypothetical protein